MTSHPSGRRSRALERGVLATAVVAGAGLAVAAAVAGRIRHGKPLHPRGLAGEASLRIEAPNEALGIPLLATRAGHPAQVRWSAAMSLPAGLPDIEGLALRLPGFGVGGGDADLLFASTGTGRLGRYTLRSRRPGRFGPQTTLLPVRTAVGPVTFAVLPVHETSGPQPPQAYDLSVAPTGGRWHRLGRLEVRWSTHDETTRYDPVQRPLAGTTVPAWVVRLREPAYAAARSAAPMS